MRVQGGVTQVGLGAVAALEVTTLDVGLATSLVFGTPVVVLTVIVTLILLLVVLTAIVSRHVPSSGLPSSIPVSHASHMRHARITTHLASALTAKKVLIGRSIGAFTHVSHLKHLVTAICSSTTLWCALSVDILACTS